MEFEEFKRIIYFTNGFIKIPFLNIRLFQEEFLIKNKTRYDFEKLNKKLLQIYEENKEKLQ